MSFALTTAAFNARTKTVTRRLRWDKLRVGEVIMGIEKGMGLKRGEKQKRLHAIRVKSVTREFVKDIRTYDGLETTREGFPGMSAEAFIDMFKEHNHCEDYTIINRIEFEHL